MSHDYAHPNMFSTSQSSKLQGEPRPRGTLSILPPEVRNEIYLNLLSKSYTVFRPRSCHVSYIHKYLGENEDWRKADLGLNERVMRGSRRHTDLVIMDTSKTIYDEVMNVLCARKKFLYIVDLRGEEATHTSAPRLVTTNQMQNITICRGYSEARRTSK